MKAVRLVALLAILAAGAGGAAAALGWGGPRAQRLAFRVARKAARVAHLRLGGGATVAAEPAATVPAPRGPHPRIGLQPAVLRALKARVGDSNSAVSRVIEKCRAASPTAGEASGYQGDAWSFAASSCALAYQLTGDTAFAARGVIYWRALLEDVAHLGDRKACLPGVERSRAIASISRDTGYAIRFIGPHAALAYDWLHDAPGVDEALRRQSRDCFHAWISWYTERGYLNDQPGANYHAGFALAKTLVAIATGGEDGERSDRDWNQVVANVFGEQLVENGLAAATGGAPTGPRRGALVGGDWAEGWQYGPLSVFEYAFAARALEEQGAREPALHAWTDDLVVRFLHGLTPSRRSMYVGGDTDEETPYLAVSGGPLLAALVGPSGALAAGWARSLRAQLGVGRYGAPAFDALAEARAVAPVDPYAGARSPWYVARGTRTVYARNGWTEDAMWSVFTSAPRLVDDHQHVDAGNFVLSRGADALVVDPSPYGTRSTLTGNAVTVDSDVVKSHYKPSQTDWSEADLTWARAARSGVVAARADFARAFIFDGQPSDVPFAVRDWIFLPEGELVLVDRVRTGASGRRVYLRFRTPAKLAAAPRAGGELFRARGQSGGSALGIHAVAITPAATPTLRSVRRAECDGDDFGRCVGARFPVDEYALELTGDETRAVHVLDALDAGEPLASVSAVGATDGGAAAGVAIQRGASLTFVVGAAAARTERPTTLAYRAWSPRAARHVVLDAPEDGAGRSAVATRVEGGNCLVSVTASGPKSFAGRPVIVTIGPASAGCPVTEDPDAPPDRARAP